MNLWVGICHWNPTALNFATRELPKSLAIDQRVGIIFNDSHPIIFNAFFAIELGCR